MLCFLSLTKLFIMNWEDEELVKLYKKLNEAQYLKRQLLKEIIETNYKETIQRAIDYIYSKSNYMFNPCQFLFQQIYKIEHGMVEPLNDSKYFDLSELDESIELSNKINEEINAYKSIAQHSI